MSKNKTQIFHFDLYGKREDKYNFLNENTLASVQWTALQPDEPNLFFVNKNMQGKEEYKKGFKVDELFKLSASGIKTQRDDASIKFTQQECDEIKNNFLSLTNEQLVAKYGFKDVRDWTIDGARKDLMENKIIANKIAYRPFDFRFMNYTGKTKGVQGYPRLDVMKHLISKENIGLILSRQFGGGQHFICFITNKIIEISSQPFAPYSISPLYLYSESNGQQSIETTPKPSNGGELERVPNLNPEIVKQIADKLGLTFTPEKFPSTGRVAESWGGQFRVTSKIWG